jgi:polysaccharide pyruvyl transferase WcaK-like protein
LTPRTVERSRPGVDNGVRASIQSRPHAGSDLRRSAIDHVGTRSIAVSRVERAVARPIRIGVLYPSGWGNLGDEAVLQATFAALRRSWPLVELRAFTLHPTRTTANHGVATDPLTGINRPLFCAPRTEEPFPVRAVRSLARRTRDIRYVGRIAHWGAERSADVVFELTSLTRAWRWLKTADLVLASGGGQLDDVWGGALGQPYALARWAWLAKRARVPFAFLSVGFGGASSWLSRRMLRYAVNEAAYCSVRDSGSRALTAQLGVRRELHVVPDLAFGLKSSVPRAAKRPGCDVAISPMTYLRPGSWPNANLAEYQRLVGLWADVVSGAAREGHRVHLFVSAPEDMAAVEDVWNRLAETTRAVTTINQAANPDELLEFYRGMDMVVSSRLHGVLLAMVAGRAVIALSHERKVRTLMNDAGASASCGDLATATVDQTMAMVRAVSDDLEACAARLSDYAAKAAAAVAEQHGLLPELVRIK